MRPGWKQGEWQQKQWTETEAGEEILEPNGKAAVLGISVASSQTLHRGTGVFLVLRWSNPTSFLSVLDQGQWHRKGKSGWETAWQRKDHSFSCDLKFFYFPPHQWSTPQIIPILTNKLPNNKLGKIISQHYSWIFHLCLPSLYWDLKLLAITTQHKSKHIFSPAFCPETQYWREIRLAQERVVDYCQPLFVLLMCPYCFYSAIIFLYVSSRVCQKQDNCFAQRTWVLFFLCEDFIHFWTRNT